MGGSPGIKEIYSFFEANSPAAKRKITKPTDSSPVKKAKTEDVSTVTVNGAPKVADDDDDDSESEQDEENNKQNSVKTDAADDDDSDDDDDDDEEEVKPDSAATKVDADGESDSDSDD